MLNQTVFLSVLLNTYSRGIASTYNTSCLVCRGLATGIKIDTLFEQPNATYLSKEISQLCPSMPKDGIDSCRIVSSNVGNIVRGLQNGTSGLQICQNLNLCNSSSNIMATKNQRQFHYENPYHSRCLSDEFNVTLDYHGVRSAICSPLCEGSDDLCVQDTPSGMVAKPSCSIETDNGLKLCSPVCNPYSRATQCSSDEHVDCVPMGDHGVCMYWS